MSRKLKCHSNLTKITGTLHEDLRTFMIFLVIKPTRYTNFSNLFRKETLHVSDRSSVHHQEFFTVHTAMVCHTGLLTACKQDQDGTDSGWNFLILLASCLQNLYDIYHCCVYSEKLLMIDRGTVQNM